MNGKPTEIFAANGAFRAVQVPAGRVAVAMKYKNPRYQWMAEGSFAMFLIAIGYVFSRPRIRLKKVFQHIR